MFTVAPHCQIMAQLDSKGSSRNLHANCVIGFLFYSHLILYVCVQTFDVIFFFKFFLNLNKSFLSPKPRSFQSPEIGEGFSRRSPTGFFLVPIWVWEAEAPWKEGRPSNGCKAGRRGWTDGEAAEHENSPAKLVWHDEAEHEGFNLWSGIHKFLFCFRTWKNIYFGREISFILDLTMFR